MSGITPFYAFAGQQGKMVTLFGSNFNASHQYYCLLSNFERNQTYNTIAQVKTEGEITCSFVWRFQEAVVQVEVYRQDKESYAVSGHEYFNFKGAPTPINGLRRFLGY